MEGEVGALKWGGLQPQVTLYFHYQKLKFSGNVWLPRLFEHLLFVYFSILFSVSRIIAKS